MVSVSNSMILEFESLDTLRHKNAKPPKQAYLYFPNERESVELDKTNPKKILRRIFEGGIKYTLFESENLDNFAIFVSKRSMTFPSDWQRYNTLRFLQAYSFDYEKTLQNIKEHIDWRNKYIPVNPSDNVKKLLNLGFFYVHGRDNRFRPILFLNPEIFISNVSKYVLDDWVRTLIYLFEYIKDQCFLPGQVENWILICDVGKSSILFMPKELKALLSILQSNYRCRLYTMYILNVSLFIKVLWKTINMVLDPSTQRKIKLLQGDPDIEREVFNTINKAQVEMKFGGLAGNIDRKFFPPIFPSNDYFTNEDDHKILVTYSKYLDIISTNQALNPSPFIIEDKNEIINPSNTNTLAKKSTIRVMTDNGDSIL